MATTTSPASVITWKLDPAHSSAEFKVKHMMISNVKGHFSGLSGFLTEHLVDSTLSSVEANVDVATITTGDAQRDGHLKSADFFDAEKYPTILFRSTRVEPKGEGEYAVSGDLRGGDLRPGRQRVPRSGDERRRDGRLRPGGSVRRGGWRRGRTGDDRADRDGTRDEC